MKPHTCLPCIHVTHPREYTHSVALSNQNTTRQHLANTAPWTMHTPAHTFLSSCSLPESSLPRHPTQLSRHSMTPQQARYDTSPSTHIAQLLLLELVHQHHAARRHRLHEGWVVVLHGGHGPHRIGQLLRLEQRHLEPHLRVCRRRRGGAGARGGQVRGGEGQGKRETCRRGGEGQGERGTCGRRGGAGREGNKGGRMTEA
jgi:hypothetical protein